MCTSSNESQWGPGRKLRAPIGTHEKDPDGRSLPHTPRKIREIFKRSPKTSESETENQAHLGHHQQTKNTTSNNNSLKLQNSRRMSISENCLHKMYVGSKNGAAAICPVFDKLKKGENSNFSRSSENLLGRLAAKLKIK